MKVLAIFALVQIVGILGGPVSSEENEISVEDVRIIGILPYFFDDDDLSRLKEYTINSTESRRLKCRMNGGPGAHDAWVESMVNNINSLAELTNETEIRLETATTLHRSLDFSVETICHWVTTANTLGKAATDALKPCLSTEERFSVDQLYNLTAAATQYVCQNKGSRILEFIAADGINCMDSSRMAIVTCIDSYIGNTSSNSELVIEFFTSLNIPILTEEPQDCIEFETFQHCVVGVLQRCANPTPSYEINSLYNAVKNAAGCRDILEANITSTPSNSGEV